MINYKRDNEIIVYLINKTQISVFKNTYRIESGLFYCTDMLDNSDLIIPLTSILYID